MGFYNLVIMPLKDDALFIDDKVLFIQKLTQLFDIGMTGQQEGAFLSPEFPSLQQDPADRFKAHPGSSNEGQFTSLSLLQLP